MEAPYWLRKHQNGRKSPPFFRDLGKRLEYDKSKHFVSTGEQMMKNHYYFVDYSRYCFCIYAINYGYNIMQIHCNNFVFLKFYS